MSASIPSGQIVGVAPELQPWMDKWVKNVSESAKRYHRQTWLPKVLLVVFVICAYVPLALIATSTSGVLEILSVVPIHPAFSLALVPTIVLFVGYHLIDRSVARLREDQKGYIEEMLSFISEHNLSAAEVVRYIATQIRGSGYRDHVIEVIDLPEATKAINHESILSDLSWDLKRDKDGVPLPSPIIHPSGWSHDAFTYAKYGLYTEAIAMLILIEIHCDSFQGWANFNFRNEVERLSRVVRGRKLALQELQLLTTMLDQTVVGALSNIDQAANADVQDQEVIDACNIIALNRARDIFTKTGKLDALLSLSYSSGELKSLLIEMIEKTFKHFPFEPDLIVTCIRRRSETESKLLALLHGNDVNERFNAAIALGLMHSDGAAKIAMELLEYTEKPLMRIGALFILASSGETHRQPEILPYLDDWDRTTAQGAAIALAYLPIPVPNDILVKHLRRTDRLIQLRLVRHVQQHTGVDSAVRDAVATLAMVDDDDVGMAAAETMSALLSGDDLFKLAKSALVSTNSNSKTRRRIMLMMSRASTQDAIDVLLWEWTLHKDEWEYAAYLIDCLGATCSLRVIDVLVSALRNGLLRQRAIGALLLVAQQHPGEVLEAVKATWNETIKLFFQALLSPDTVDIDDFIKHLQKTGDKELALQLAAILAHPALEDTLERMHTANMEGAFQGYARQYLAVKASFSVLFRQLEI